jgi:CRP-like cAMP-binding protein
MSAHAAPAPSSKTAHASRAGDAQDLHPVSSRKSFSGPARPCGALLGTPLRVQTSPAAPRTHRLLRTNRVACALDAPSFSALAASAVLRRSTRGEHLWRAGDSATHFTFVIAGLVKIVASGTRSIVGIFGPRESLGDTTVVQRLRHTTDAIVASGVAEVIHVAAGPILASMTTRVQVASALNDVFLAQTEALHEKIRVMSAGAVPNRLATLFLSLGERFGDEQEDGSISIPVPLTRAELASMIGARVETTIRIARVFERAGTIATTREGFQILDPAALRVTAGDNIDPAAAAE